MADGRETRDDPQDNAGARWYFPAAPSVAAELPLNRELHAGHPAAPGSNPEPRASELASALVEAAKALGFVRIGFAPVEKFERGGRALRNWLAEGHAGDMSYLADQGPRHDPRELLGEARTLIAVALPYATPHSVPLSTKDGRVLVGSIARYAQGSDYHDVFRDKLRALAKVCAKLLERPVLARVCVDTAPLLEREAAARAGFAFLGKNTLAIVPGVGSYVLLGELLVDVELFPGTASEPKCGTCRACLDACPTGAFTDAYVLDARRCISYLTIEHTGPIPRELRRPIGTRVFGCDVCQDVCPFNASRAERPIAPELTPRPELAAVDLVQLLELSASGYRRLVRKTSLRRANRATLARNAAVALGNTHDARALPALVRALERDRSGVVRSHAAWALGELGESAGAEGLKALEAAATGDADESVREEAALASARVRETRSDPRS